MLIFEDETLLKTMGRLADGCCKGVGSIASSAIYVSGVQCTYCCKGVVKGVDSTGLS